MVLERRQGTGKAPAPKPSSFSDALGTRQGAARETRNGTGKAPAPQPNNSLDALETRQGVAPEMRHGTGKAPATNPVALETRYAPWHWKCAKALHRIRANYLPSCTWNAPWHLNRVKALKRD